MKTLLNKFVRVLSVIITVGAISGLVACGDNEENKNSDPGVYWINGKCRSSENHEKVEEAACKSTGEYFVDRNQCVERATDRVVSMRQCDSHSDYYIAEGKCYNKYDNTRASMDFCYDNERPQQYRQYYNNNYNNYRYGQQNYYRQ